jgi:hypothetical protein
MANGANNFRPLLTIHKQIPRINRTVRRETQCRQATHKVNNFP